MIRIDRRQLVKSAGLGLGALLVPGGAAAVAQMLGARGFTHGVASGEPAADSVLLWTRYVPATGESARLRAEIAETADFGRVVGRSELLTGAFRDWTTKATLAGLDPSKRYFYRFVAPDGASSPVGRTRTLPEGRVPSYRIAVFSCSNLPFGHFNAYAHAAARDDLDLAVHLGDYFYEYPRGTYPSLEEALAGRVIEPAGEIVHLADYRLRYASYRSDPDLQAIHAALPMLVQQDDHESANDAWEGGAQNHGAGEGDWSVRKAAALQAWREWMPVSDEPWKAYDIGDLATFFRTEGRLLGRTKPPHLPSPAELVAFRDGAWMDPAASMFGSAQEAWLAHELKHSVRHKRRWQVVGSGTIVGRMTMPEAALGWLRAGDSEGTRRFVERAVAAGRAGLPFALDSWAGYPAARSRFLKSAQEADANLIVIAGDSHNAWAYELAEGGKPAGVEFDGHSVTSPGFERDDSVARGLVEANPELKWAATQGRGYFTLTLTPEAATSEWSFLETIAQRSTRIARTHRMQVKHGKRVLEAA